MDIKDFRREYLLDGLHQDNLVTCPFSQFDTWFSQIVKTDIADPSAMILSTSDASGMPSSRIVLLKDYSEKGFIFYTNYDSEKGQDISENPNVSLLFAWPHIERQIRINGIAKKTDIETSTKYFQSRPRDSQLSAWASRQSLEVKNRESLEEQLDTVTEKFKDIDKLPVPEFWGGYNVIPTYFEFWQGGAKRLHDRFAYEQSDNKNSWDIKRLQP